MLDYRIAGRSVLEVGCGIGLGSLVLNARQVDITATDQNPEAGEFLAENTRLNDAEDIPFIRAGWVEGSGELPRFDLLIGSDLLYEPDHAVDLSAFIDRHARRIAEVILVDPGRGGVNQFTRQMEEFGFRSDPFEPSSLPVLDPVFRGKYLRYFRGDG